MRFRESQDGILRATMSIRLRIGFDELVLATYHEKFDFGIELKNRREVIKGVREFYSTHPYNTSLKDIDENAFKFAHERISILFPELSAGVRK